MKLKVIGRNGVVKPLVVVAVIGGVAMGAATATGTVSFGLMTLLGVLFGTAIVHRRMRLWELSPVAVLLFSYLAVALLGPLLAGAATEALGAGARITLSPEENSGTFVVFMVAAAGTIAGALIVSVASGSVPVPSKRDKKRSRSSPRMAVMFAMAPAILTVLLYRGALLERPDYLVGGNGSPLVIVAQVLAIPAIVTLGWLAKSSDSMEGKVLGYGGILIYVVLLFSLATRALSLVPLLVTIGILAADPSSKKSHVLLLLAAVGSIFLLQTPLALRGSSEHGLLPYMATLFDQQSSSSGLSAAASNILFSYALTGAVAFHAHPIDWSWAFVSLDPRPGQFTNWYAIQPLLRVNPATPDNALGELANLGLGPVFAFFLVIGGFFGYLDHRIRHLLSDGNTFVGLLLFALAAFFVLETLQYNLRSSSRVIYYLIVAEVGTRLCMRVWGRRRRRTVIFHPQQIAGLGSRVETEAPAHSLSESLAGGMGSKPA